MNKPMPPSILLRWLALWALLLGAHCATGATNDDAALEARVLSLSQNLRCLVCQNQSIADSNAELAIDLRQQVREQLRQGKSEQQVTEFLVQRYGQFVLYKPPLQGNTTLLWLGPFVLLAIALLFWCGKLGRHTGSPANNEASADMPANIPATAISATSHKRQGILLIAAIFLAAIGLYTQLGNPAALNAPPPPPPAIASKPVLSEEQVQARVEQIKALLLIASSKTEQGDYAAAMAAWQKIQKLVTPDSALAGMAAENILQLRTSMNSSYPPRP